MKQTIKNYSFNKTAKTVTFTDFSSISLDRVFLITNVTSNTIIYQFNGTGLGGAVSTNVLTLTYDTSAMSNTDKLQIIYDCATGDPNYDTLATVTSNNGQSASNTATWTTSTTVNTTLLQSTVGYATAIVTSVETGTTTTAGALIFEGYDGTNWWPINGQQVGSFVVQSSYTLLNNANVAWTFDVAGFQQFRVRLSTAITGTGTPQVVLAMQLQAASNVIAPSVGWAQKLDAVNDAVTTYPFGHSYSYISTAATTTVKSGTGILKSIIVNGGTAGTVILYDNTAGSGTVIASFDSTNALATYPFELTFNTGLTVVTGAATKVTVIYR